MIRRPGRRHRTPLRPSLRTADLRLGERLLAGVLAFGVAAVPVALLLVLIEANWPPLQRLDAGTAWYLHASVRDRPGVLAVLRFLSDGVWDPLTMRLLIAATVAWLLWRRAWRLAVWAAATVTASGLIGLVVKVTVARARPALPDPVTHAPGFSFPSGHSMTAATCCAVLLLVFAPVLGRRWLPVARTVAVISVLGVGCTRIALGAHWVSDVLAGWMLGSALVAATAWAFEGWRRDTGRSVPPPLTEGLEPELVRHGPAEPGTIGRR
ncbi:phosphatase PAP2 family protein [Kitasatospora purpeofusca]|uniref:phosphatase PAP2 family protein n=1 Tax=Kitasatospora purpeofusca TaxID=67352 RepID=UPI00369ECBBB